MRQNRRNEWISFEEVDHDGITLLCFPHAGSGPSVFRKWQNLLPSGINIGGVCLPGREWRYNEPLIMDMRILIKQLYEGLRTCLRGRYAFFGHSMGAVLAFELARKVMLDGGVAPQCLFVSARSAPDEVSREQFRNDQGGDDDIIARASGLSDASARVLAESELKSIILPILRADFALCQDYKTAAKRRLGCRVVAFAGEDDQTVPIEHMQAWERWTHSDFELRIFPGGHLFILEHAESLCDEVARQLTTRPGQRQHGD